MAHVSGYHRLVEFSKLNAAGPSPGLSVGSGRSSPPLAYAHSSLNSHLGSTLPRPLAAGALPFRHLRLQVSAPLTRTFQLRLHSRPSCHSPLLALPRSRPSQQSLLSSEMKFYRGLANFLGKTISGPEVVFSFRGPDTRTGFAYYLFKALEAVGVSVYWDSRDVPLGETIENELLQAIRTCRIAIPIISPRFVESRWCNLELAEMIKCRKECGLLVIPIYHKVDYVDVGCHSGKFGEDLRKHEKRLSTEEVQEFYKALISVAGIQGWSSQTVANGHEAELVGRVVEDVLSKLKMMYIEQLPSFVRSACLNILEKKRRESECQVLLVVDDRDIESSFADHLKVSLESVGIRVFSSDNRSLLGKDIACQIRYGIDNCKICIPIVTEKFYSSRYFHETIVQIFESKKTNGLVVCPIFLNVMPSLLRRVSQRHLEGGSTCEQARALMELASISGWESNNGKQGEFVKRVVGDVKEKLLNT